jgi:hypothetical protein
MLDLAKMEDFSSDFWWTSLGVEKRGVYTLVTMTHTCGVKLQTTCLGGRFFFNARQMVSDWVNFAMDHGEYGMEKKLGARHPRLLWQMWHFFVVQNTWLWSKPKI